MELTAAHRAATIYHCNNINRDTYVLVLVFFVCWGFDVDVYPTTTVYSGGVLRVLNGNEEFQLVVD